MTISFNSIPINLLVPGSYGEFDNSKATRGTPAMPNRIVVIAQRLASGTVAAGVPTLILSPDRAVQAFGRGSMLATSLQALKAANKYTEVWGIALDDNPAGNAAQGSVAFTAQATVNGTFTLYIGATPVQIAVLTTDTPAQLATKLAAAIAALPDLIVTGAVDGAVAAKVNITFRHKGLAGNDLDLRTHLYQGDEAPVGLAWTLVAMTGGTANPSLAPAIAAAGDVWYTHWIVPYNDGVSTTALATELDRRFGPLTQIDGRGYTYVNGTVGTAAALGAGLNTQHITVFGTILSPTPGWILAAVEGAIAAYNLNIDPARPLTTLQLPGVIAPAQADRPINTDRQFLLQNGISTFTVDDGGNVLIERVVTTYKTNAYGLPDPSYRDIQVLATLSFLRYSFRARVTQRFPRYKLADDDTRIPAGQATVRPKDIRNELIALAHDWEGIYIEDAQAFAAALIVERDDNDPNRVNILEVPNLINMLLVFAGKFQFVN